MRYIIERYYYFNVIKYIHTYIQFSIQLYSTLLPSIPALLNPSSALLNPSTYGHQTDTRLSITLPTVTFAISSWIARTDPKDVARVESKTYISTDRKEDTIPTVKSGVKG